MEGSGGIWLPSYRKIGIVAALGVTILGAVANVAAAGNTLRLEPATTTVAKDATFTIRVVQNATVATSGAQVTVTFDRTKAQVTTVTRGTPYANAALFLGADAAAITNANKTGKLKTVAAAFLPPGAVPVGDKDFITVDFKATACGEIKLGLPVGAADAGLLDGRDAKYGAALKVTGTGATVTVDCGANAPTPTPVGATETPAGSVLGETSSPGTDVTPDPLASTPPGESPPPAASGSVEPGASPSGSPVALASADPCPTCTDRSDWLDFGLAAMGVAASGLALLIVLVLIAFVGASIVGSVLLYRHWRRSRGRAPARESEGPRTGGSGLR
jgi:hypothetical protein